MDPKYPKGRLAKGRNLKYHKNHPKSNKSSCFEKIVIYFAVRQRHNYFRPESFSGTTAKAVKLTLSKTNGEEIIMANKNWFPNTMPSQLVMFQNVRAKSDIYQTVLPLTLPQVERLNLICDIFVSAYTFSAQAKSAMEGVTNWRDNVFTGSPAGAAAPVPPTFVPASMPVGSFIGIFEEFRKMVDLIKSSPGYTRAIGEDLMIVASSGADTNATNNPIVPELKVSTALGYQVIIAGSLKGMDAMRVEYRAKNGEWTLAGFFTNMPNSFTVMPQTPGAPEIGYVRGVFIKKSLPVGNPSPEYPVTVS